MSEEWWKPKEPEERKFLEMIFGMTSDCLRGDGTKDKKTYISNLRIAADLLEKENWNDSPESGR